MQSGVAKAHKIFAFLVLAGALLQFFFAGLGVFDNAWDPHGFTGSVIQVLALVVLVLAAVARVRVVLSAVLFVLLVLQSVLLYLAEVSGVIGALHPVNGVIILVVAHQVARGTGLAVPGGGAGEPGAPHRSAARVA